MTKYIATELFELFTEANLSGLFSDSKTIADLVPKTDWHKIESDYKIAKIEHAFNVKTFVENHFDYQNSESKDFVADKYGSLKNHVNTLWPWLTRFGDKEVSGSSLITLPNDYVVPGGRFNEVYYWDSYFTMIGLREAGKFDLIESMVDNFSHLVQTIGFIPNGNRAYYLGRSQPPFFALMVSLLCSVKGDDILIKYLPSLLKEYQFWMENRSISIEGHILNRYYDNHEGPRIEMYADDVHLSYDIIDKQWFYKNVRAACESGWDFSSRWFADEKNINTIRTIDIIPIDLNCLLYFMEDLISKSFDLSGQQSLANEYQSKAEKRAYTINDYFWNKDLGCFTDLDCRTGLPINIPTAAMVYPLFMNIATEHQAQKTSEIIIQKFLKEGGIVTTLNATGQQWDSPNGWAPLQWMAVVAFSNYNYDVLAKEIAARWIKLNEDVFKRTGKMLEKYNVVDTSLEGGGGEYPVQDGFGWTNGVYLGMKAIYHTEV